MKITLKYDIPKDILSDRAARGKILRSLQIVGDRARKDFQSTTATWTEHKVEFPRPTIRYAGGDVRITIEAKGDERSLAIWGWLDTGTYQRWAVLSRNWVSKTWPGRIAAEAGQGYAWLRGRSQMEAHGFGVDFAEEHAIEGRHWIDIISENYAPILDNFMEDSVDFITGYWI